MWTQLNSLQYSSHEDFFSSLILSCNKKRVLLKCKIKTNTAYGSLGRQEKIKLFKYEHRERKKKRNWKKYGWIFSALTAINCNGACKSDKQQRKTHKKPVCVGT